MTGVQGIERVLASHRLARIRDRSWVEDRFTRFGWSGTSSPRPLAQPAAFEHADAVESGEQHHPAVEHV
ncbi:hypothetical protein [Actinoalloteichus hymeniacidonis]|uniref:Uncharacterized protein n=1 Tax=Actinoalloteichus hymeniacidonis TaxID=340345 RepID=A0AAC9MZA0_9PSEU|nr:hypothetical protein [Actinoalloteichus hymeniacidonis]AOS64125.1 hypothetical protein TL08_16625 [Actinoalloteichus hymeniacidonis]MBB5907811.1 hypothetical protein [Actinoalloteichus hymeniacidonis]